MATIEHNGYTIVDGVLQLDDLRVEGMLDIEGCTALTKLPDGLSVEGRLILSGCTALTKLPDGLSVGRWLDIEGCTALTALPDGLSVGRWLDIEGCTALTKLPDGLSVGDSISIDNLYLSRDRVVLFDLLLPDTIRTEAIGRRLGDLIEHWALSWNGMRDQIIESIEEDGDEDLVFRLRPYAADMSSGLEDSTASVLGDD